MRVLLTGGTGYIGSAVLRDLVAADHHVTAVVRSTKSKQVVERAGAVGIVGDLFDRPWLASELGLHAAAIHTAAGGDGRDAELNDAVIDAAIEAFSGTDKRFLLTGGIWTFGSNPVITETSTPEPPELTSWRPAGEDRVLEADFAGTVVAPGIVYGHGGGIPAMVSETKILPGSGDQHWTTIHVDDLSALYLAALSGKPGRYVAVNGDNPTVAEIGRQIPGSEPEGDEATLERLGAFGEALLLDQSATGRKARAELGWQPSHHTLIEELSA